MFKIEEYFDFYFITEDLTYRSVPEKVASLIIENASWDTLEGVTLQDQNLKISPTKVTWNSGSYRYSVGGLKVIASCVARVSKDAKPGERKISVELPNLAVVSSVLKAVPDFPNNKNAFTHPNMLLIKTFSIHASKAGKILTRAVKWTLTIIVVIVVMAIWLWAKEE